MKKSLSDIKPDVRVLFIGACFLDTTMRQWLVTFQTSGQAFILTKKSTPTFLGAAAEAWTAMLVDLEGVGTNPTSVSTAVDFGNQYLSDHLPSPKPQNYVQPVFKPIGDGNVKIKASQ